MWGRRSTDLDVRDAEREDRPARERRRAPEYDGESSEMTAVREHSWEDYRGFESADTPQPVRPYGFFLVLAAMVVVALMYSVTMFILRGSIAPATAIGAMSAAFAVIGTLVGTYFGIKAGLDGQDKVKETVSRAVRGTEGRQRFRTRREEEE
jgi:hypothetical protein